MSFQSFDTVDRLAIFMVRIIVAEDRAARSTSPSTPSCSAVSAVCHRSELEPTACRSRFMNTEHWCAQHKSVI